MSTLPKNYITPEQYLEIGLVQGTSWTTSCR
jgi:hypothetical protein